jgi:F-type H+-transporting ATPase subunit c
MRNGSAFRFLFLLSLILLAVPAFAQGGAAAPTAAGTPWAVPIAAGIGMAIASGLCGLAQGRATGSAVEGLARNPGATNAIRFHLILGLILIESLALYTFAIIFVKVK